MKFDVSKSWCETMARLEDGSEIGAGATPQPTTPTDADRQAAWALLHSLENSGFPTETTSRGQMLRAVVLIEQAIADGRAR